MFFDEFESFLFPWFPDTDAQPDKQDAAPVNSAQPDKQDASPVNNAQPDKQDVSPVNNAQPDKQDVSAVNNAQLDKQDVSPVNNAQPDKQDVSAVNNAQLDKQDASPVNNVRILESSKLRFEPADSSNVCMAPIKDSSKRRQQNVEAAKKSYENKKKEYSSLHEANRKLLDDQMDLLREKAKLEHQLKYWREALGLMEHCCSDCDTLVTSSSSTSTSSRSYFCPAGVIDMTQDDEEDGTIVEDDQFVGGSPADYDVDDETAALDLSLKTSAARAEEAYRSVVINDCSLSEHALQYDAVTEEYGSTLGLGATQEVELIDHKGGSKKSKKRVTFSDSVGNGKKLKTDIFTPPMCATVY